MYRVLFRVDDGPGIGAGHLMRCFALAEEIKRSGGEVYLSTVRNSSLHSNWSHADATIYVESRIIGSQTDLSITRSVAQEIHADWLVVDGYSFDTEWLNSAESDCRVLYIDDLGVLDPKVSIVLNHNPGAEYRYRMSYQRCGRALLGLEWFLIRQVWGESSYRPIPLRLLLTVGGDDQDNRSLKLMNALLADGREFVSDVVSSAPSAGFIKELQFEEIHSDRFILHRGPVALQEFMCRAGAVICGGGVTSIEAISIGLFPVIVILAENQRPGAEYLETKGVARVKSLVDNGDSLDAAHLALDILHSDIKKNTGRNLVDGNGAERIVTIMKKVCI